MPDRRGWKGKNVQRFYFPDASQISALVGDDSRQMKTQIFTVGTSALNCWAPVSPSYICVQIWFFWRIFHFPPNLISWETGTIWARSIQPKFQPVRPGKVVHLKRWTRFFKTFPVGPNRSIEFGPKFPEILVEWITPYKSKRASHNISRFCLIQLPVFLCLLLLWR